MWMNIGEVKEVLVEFPRIHPQLDSTQTYSPIPTETSQPAQAHDKVDSAGGGSCGGGRAGASIYHTPGSSGGVGAAAD